MIRCTRSHSNFYEIAISLRLASPSILVMNPSVLQNLTVILHSAFGAGKSLGVWLCTCMFVSHMIMEAREGTQSCLPLVLLCLDQT